MFVQNIIKTENILLSCRIARVSLIFENRTIRQNERGVCWGRQGGLVLNEK